jgi:GTP-binding protein HflX
VASFRSTLEEARHADLLLHVVDASSPAAEQQITTVNDVLKEIGIDSARAVLVLNKIDALRDRSYLDVLRANHELAVSVSAAKKTGLDQLARVVAERLGEGYVEATLETGVGNGRLLSYLAAHAEVVREDYVDSRVTLHCRIPRRYLGSLPGDDLELHLTNGHDASANGAAAHE